MDLIQALQRQGWYLSENGIKECSKRESSTSDDVIREAINLDLRQIGERHLPENLGKSKTEFVDGPFVLQLQKLRNVSAPKDAEYADSGGGQKLWRLALTDGQSTCMGIDMNGISGLSGNTPPGSKIKLLGKVPIHQGFLLLTNSNCKVLGGRVEKLVESWELKKALTAESRSSALRDGGGAPRFIPFGQRTNDVKAVPTKRDNFKSLEAAAKKKESNFEFDQQRKQIIEAALQEGKTKTFGVASAKQPQTLDRNVATIVEMGFTADEANVALRKSAGNLQEALNGLLGDSGEPVQPLNGNRNSSSNQASTARSTSHGGVSSDRPDRTGQGGRGNERGSRRNGRNDETDDFSEQHSRPSAPATLFDFVTSKIPNNKSDTSSSSVTRHSVDSPDVAAGSYDGRRRNRSPEDAGGGRRDGKNWTSHVDHADNYYSASSSQSYHNNNNNPRQHHQQPMQQQQQQNLPPRLQRKQQHREDDGVIKFFGKDSSSGAGGGAGAAAGDWSRDRQSSRVYDVNTRGPVSNKNLWKEEEAEDERNVRDHRRPESDRGLNVVAAGAGAPIQTLHHVVQPLMECSPCTIQPLMHCAPDMQVVHSMSGLHLYATPAPVYAGGTAQSEGYGSSRVGQQENVQWKEGDICMARWKEDKQFYRAKILQKEENRVIVNFIDYDDTQKLQYSDLMPMMQPKTGLIFQPSVQPNAGILYAPSHNGQFSAAPVSAGQPGIFVPAPATFSSYHVDQQQQQSFRIFSNSNRSSAAKPKSTTEKMLYVPPAGRK